MGIDSYDDDYDNETQWSDWGFFPDSAFKRYLAYDPELQQPTDSPTNTSALTPQFMSLHQYNPHKSNVSSQQTIVYLLCAGLLAIALVVSVLFVKKKRKNRQLRNVNEPDCA